MAQSPQPSAGQRVACGFVCGVCLLACVQLTCPGRQLRSAYCKENAASEQPQTLRNSRAGLGALRRKHHISALIALALATAAGPRRQQHWAVQTRAQTSFSHTARPAGLPLHSGAIAAAQRDPHSGGPPARRAPAPLPEALTLPPRATRAPRNSRGARHRALNINSNQHER